MRKLSPLFKDLTPTKLKTASVAVQKRVFLALMEEGWKDKGWVNGIRHADNNVCALGAAEVGVQQVFGENYYYSIEGLLPALHLHKRGKLGINALIASASNDAGSKSAAIAAVKAISWARR